MSFKKACRMSVSALQTTIWSLKVTNIIAQGKTVEDGEIFVAHVARRGKNAEARTLVRA